MKESKYDNNHIRELFWVPITLELHKYLQSNRERRKKLCSISIAMQTDSIGFAKFGT